MSSADCSETLSLRPRKSKIWKSRDQTAVFTGKGRKTKAQHQILINYFERYDGKWDDQMFRELVEKTGFNKRQLNKWFWDRRKKVTESLRMKRVIFPGILFRVTNAKTGKDLTPDFRTLVSKR